MAEPNEIAPKVLTANDITVLSKFIQGSRKDGREGEVYYRTSVTIDAEVPAGYLDEIRTAFLKGYEVQVTFTVTHMTY